MYLSYLILFVLFHWQSDKNKIIWPMVLELQILTWEGTNKWRDNVYLWNKISEKINVRLVE
jgi:hypothetical protein